MIKRPTWIILLVLALVIGAYFLIKNRPASIPEETPTAATSAFVFSETDGLLKNLRIYDRNGNIFQMQRSENNAWIVILPNPGGTDQGLAGAAEAQVGALRIITLLETPPSLSDIGLIDPMYIIEFGFDGNVTHTLTVGDLTPTNSGYYAQFDDKNVYVISQAGIDSLINLLTSPPYLATSTPTMEPVLSPTPDMTTPTS
jgi:hypothetical protein